VEFKVSPPTVVNSPERSSTLPTARWRREIFLLVTLTGLWTLGWLVREPGVLQGLDYSRYYFFNADWLRRSLLHGQIPWWNPHVGLGRPFFGDLQTGVLYPPSWLHILLGVPTATIVLVWSHLIWGAAGTFRLGLRLGHVRPVAWGVAAAFVIAPCLTTRFISGQILYGAGMCYLPGLLWLLLRLLDRPSARRMATLAGVSALQLLSGHPQIYWVTHFALGSFALAWLAGDSWRLAVPRLGLLAAAVLLGFALTGPVFLPFLELIGESDRAGSSAYLSTQGAMHAHDWLGLILPPSARFMPDLECQILVGIPALLMAIALLPRWRADRAVRALIVLALVAAFLASAMPEWLNRAIAAGLPGFASFRLPARLGVLVVLAVFLLAGKWLSSTRAPRWVRIGAVGLTMVSLGSALPGLKQWYVMPMDYPAEAYVGGLVRELQADDPAHVPPRINFSTRLARENSGMLIGHSTFNAYVSLNLGRVWEYVHLAAGLPPPTSITTFPDVQIFYRDPFVYHSMNLVAGYDTRTRETRLNLAPDPRAYLCPAVERVKDWHAANARLAAGVNFHAVALVESPVVGFEGGGTGRATIIAFANESVKLRTEASGQAVLVLAEAWYPGWEAEVNGKPAPVFPVNGWMRGVVVPTGQAEVTWRYRSRWIVHGCAIGAAALAALLAALRRKEPEPVA
jgi:hypothetical protein